MSKNNSQKTKEYRIVKMTRLLHEDQSVLEDTYAIEFLWKKPDQWCLLYKIASESEATDRLQFLLEQQEKRSGIKL